MKRGLAATAAKRTDRFNLGEIERVDEFLRIFRRTGICSRSGGHRNLVRILWARDNGNRLAHLDLLFTDLHLKTGEVSA